MENTTPEEAMIWEERFDEKFGKDGDYLCQYDPGWETHTSNHLDVKSFITSEIQRAEKELIQRVREDIKNDVRLNFCYEGCACRERMYKILDRLSA